MKKLLLILPLLICTVIVKAQFSSQQIISNDANYAAAVYAADLDGDGDLDVLSASSEDGKIAWYENMTGGIIDTVQHIISINADTAQSVYAADLDGDGDMDVLSASRGDNKIAWYENIGGGNIDTSQHIISVNASKASSVYAADLDGDGDMDVLSASKGDGKIAWYENLGAGSIGPEQIITINANGASSVYAADMDGDSDMDVLSASIYDNKIAWYENIGSGFFSVEQIITTNADWAESVFVSDMDNDGDMDVLTASWFKITWHENIGGGNIDTAQNIITTNVLGVNSVYTADIDGDGDMDVLSASNNEIAWYKNLGGGVIDPTQFIITTSAVGANFVYAADLDGDGDSDILSSSFFDDRIAWYENYFNSAHQLKGRFFYDDNQNGIIDTNDFGLLSFQSQLLPAGLATYSYNNGNYFYAVDNATYTVNYVQNSLWALTTDSLTYTRTLNEVNTIIDSLDFGFYPDTIITVIESELTGGFPRCNEIVNYWISIQNSGTTIPSGIIHLQLDASISYYTSIVPPDSIIGNNLYWHYDSLFYSFIEMINLQVLMPPFTSIGDTLTSFLTVTELDSLGNIVYINTDSLNQILVCAYDPNDKSVTPKGIGSEGYIENNQELEYLIRFQNTGNDTAITVMVRDQLDENLNWSTLQPIANSHPVQISIEQDGEAVFKLENIMLPDSGATFLGSQGFVKYKVDLNPGLDPGTSIYNTANIYFDQNPAVVTNTVLNTIECYGTPQAIISYNFPYLESGVTGNYSFQWYLNDVLIVGATSDTLTPLVDGNYTVEVLDTNSCPKLSQPYTFISVGIEELSQLKSIVFPNPFSKSTTILFNKNLNGAYDLLVYDIVGKEVKRINKIAGNKVEINKNEIGKGLFLTFLINSKTGERIFIEKLVVQ